MASETWAVARQAAIPFLAGAAASAALFGGLYATATLSALVALWAASIIHHAGARRTAPVTATPLGAARASATVDIEERQQLRLYLDLSPAPLVALDAADRLRAINRAARRLFAADDLITAPSPDLITAIAATAPGFSATVQLATAQGEHGFALSTADLHAAGGAMRVAALIDIDADLKAAEAATLRDLVQVLGHEITNTLTPIASLSATAAAMMAEPDADVAAIREAIETVARRAQGLQRFGEAYRDFARLPPATIAPVDLATLVGDLARLFLTRWPLLALTTEIDSRMAKASVDADQISQALWALLQNAAEAASSVTISLAYRDTGISFRVGDHGPGIVQEDREIIFRPFFTTKASGTGIGLALARQVFRSHGGDLRLVEGLPGQTVFEGLLPIRG